MTNEAEMRTKFWEAVKSDMTMFLGIVGEEDGHARPMTAQLDENLYKRGEYHGPVWFFTSTDNALYQMIQQGELAGQGKRANAHFVSKGHDLWAAIHGSLTTTRDRAVIDKLWNRFVAAWYEGKDDPKIALIRLDAELAHVWIDASSVVAGMKMLLGIDPKEDYKDKVAEVQL
ncbi:pyridoxamine 5'-phosphate oxidase family protein [Porphyrobacter sp. AAP60]|uniref:pyridoxamine 5'-phosphate oxidase family protein n=1 Tax=Porphyrobacter sp. AAP60 TaxID=1523423 RepID=UPI0006B965CC|nr:pyridoxamine 5'-phosphate oxidase family protein [Porphyrobacter sp. AAP60]KPF63678.1 general stress protein [Porphyrobacter sp. AAP60]